MVGGIPSARLVAAAGYERGLHGTLPRRIRFATIGRCPARFTPPQPPSPRQLQSSGWQELLLLLSLHRVPGCSSSACSVGFKMGEILPRSSCVHRAAALESLAPDVSCKAMGEVGEPSGMWAIRRSDSLCAAKQTFDRAEVWVKP